MATKITDLQNQVLTTFGKGRSLSIAVVLLLSFGVFGSLIFWNSQPDYQVLFSNLSPEDAGEMAHKLKEKKIPFKLSHSGTALMVPREQVYDLRLSLSAEGLPKGGGIGFEVFDRTPFGTTDFVQKLNYQRALQGELSRTIRQIKEIEQARVHIVTPKESLFIEEQKKATASIFIKTRSGMALNPSQVEGIVHLVSSAVEGLEPGNITVVDMSGKVLSKRADASPIGQLTTMQFEYQRNIEEGLKRKLQGMLEEVLGPNKAIARVSTEIDFQQIDITEERYDPNTILRSEQKNTERSSNASGTTMAKEGKVEIPSGTNTPKVSTAPPQPFNNNSSERQHEIRNYEISRINKHVKNSSGQIKRVSVAVIVDGIYEEGKDSKSNKVKKYVPRSQDEMKNFENIVKKAIGYSEQRGDQVEVINMPFYGSVNEEENIADKKTPWWQEYSSIAFKPIVSLVLVLLFILFVVRPVLKKKILSVGTEGLLPQPSTPQMIPREVTQEVAQKEMRTPAALNIKDQTIKLIQEDPPRTVGIVKGWIREKE